MLILNETLTELREIDCLRNDTNKTRKVASITTSFLVLVLSLIGNLLVVAVFFKNKTLRTPVHYFIVNMAVSDLIIPVVYVPLVIAEQYYDGLWIFDGVIGTLLCKLGKVAWSISITVSIFSMVSIAVDRFHAILFAMKPPLISRRTCLQGIVLMWITSTVVQAHIIYGYGVVRKDSGIYCEFQWEPVAYTKKVKQIFEVLFLILSAVSAVVLTVLYSSIIIFLHKRKSSIHMASEIVKRRAKENRKVTCMLIIVVIVFCVVWIPNHVRFFILYFRPNLKLPYSFLSIANGLPSFYTAINPVVYFVFNEKYHRGFKELLCCLWPCNKKCCHSSIAPLSEDVIQGQKQAENPREHIELREQR